jgi:diguanylate cyclase (GGDEF)-like protein
VALPHDLPSNSGSRAERGNTGAPDPLVILNSIGEVVYDWDILSDRLAWGPNVRRVLGLSDETPINTGRDFADLASAEGVESRHDTIVNSERADRGAGVPYQVRYGLWRTGDARPATMWVEDTGRWFAGPDGRPARAHGLLRVMIADHNAGRGMLTRSHFDPLTGCINRAHLMEIVAGNLGRAKNGSEALGILLVGIENLSALNRSHGYDAVDELIAGVAAILRGQIRGTDFLARYSGNKFALVLQNTDAERLRPAAARILDLTMRAPIGTTVGPLDLVVRIGGVLAPCHGRTAHMAMQHAEQALDLARTPDAPAFVLYDPSITREQTVRRVNETAIEIVAALNEGRVAIALQPIVAASDGQPVMAEALLRIRRRDGSILGPQVILPIAEQHQLLGLLDRRVLELVVARLARLRPAISMNVSATSLRDPEWPAQIAALERLYPGVASRLIVETSEAEAVADIETACATFEALRKHGVRIAIDHFGTGHATPHMLRRLSPDYVKIDGAFVQNLSRSPDDRFFVRSLLSVARHIETAVIAEWVENGETARVLAEWGAHYLQGLHFGAPELVAEPAAPPVRTAVA